VAKVDNVRRVYARPSDPARPLVCCDEAGKELTAHVRLPLPARCRQPAREDSEYARAGTAKLFLACAPHRGRREVTVHTQRTARDRAHARRDLGNGHFPEAEQVVLVLDHLNTHDPASLDEAFPPAEAARPWSRLELHYTPTHGSWLNMAELEPSALARQGLHRRILDRAILQTEVGAWDYERNRAAVRTDGASRSRKRGRP
jgi:hypothetical protein